MLSNYLMEIVNTDRASTQWKVLARDAAENPRRFLGNACSPKIEAIKAARNEHRLTLKDAKDLVEYYMANYLNIKESDLATYNIERNGVIIQVTQTGADRWSVRRIEDLGTFTHKDLMVALLDIGEGRS